MKHLPEAFFPTSDRDMFRIEIFMPESASMDATRSMALAVNEHVKNVDGIEGAEWFVGSNAPAFYYNMLSSRRGAQNYAEGMITASHFTVANDLIPKLQEELDAAFPSAQILVRKLLQGPPITAPIEIRLYGPNLDTLKAYGNDLRRIMAQTPHVTHTRSGLSSTVPKMQVAIDEEQSLRSALPLNAVADQLRGSLDGIVRGSVIEATEEIPVRIRLQNNARENLSDLANIDLQAQLRSDKSYSGVPMSALAELSLTPGAGVIPRRDGQRVNDIEAYLEGGVLASNVLKNIQKNMDAAGFKLPHGYELEIGGESDARAEAVAKLLGNIGVIISLLVLVVVLSFNSFRMSSIIFATAILAAGLGLLSLLISGYPFGFTPIIALLGLIGLAINAAIVILAELRSDPAATRGDKQAILHGVQACSRHISSTTVTTFGGFLPLIIAGGGMWPPFAVTIAGGTLLCTIVSFYFVPAAFLLFARKRAFVAKIETPAEVQSAQSA
jgi:multidrug efflux pump subunit AcrB